MVSNVMILQTSRLKIEKASEVDVDFFFQLLNSPNWIKNIGDRGIDDKTKALAYIQNSLIKSYQIHGFGLYKMITAETHIPIGICGFVKREYLNYSDIGFAILPEYEGLGYTSEAIKGLIDYGFSKLGLLTILGITNECNNASCHLLQKSGLKKVGKFTENKGEELLLFSNSEVIPINNYFTSKSNILLSE